MAKKNEQPHQRSYWRIEIIGGLTFVVLVVIIGIFISGQRPIPPATTNTPLSISTPMSFTDFIGRVTVIHQDNVSVQFTGTGRDGKNYTKQYLVILDKQTVFKTVMTVNTEVQLTPFQLSELQIGDTVFVAGEVDLATLNYFTATKLFRYQPAT